MIISNKISHSIVHRLSENQRINPEYTEAYQYCIEQFLDLIIFNLSLLILGVFLNRFSLAIFYIITITPIKMLAGGAHANSRGLCSFLSYSVYLGAVFLSPYLPFSKQCILIMLLPVETLIFILTPVKHPDKDLTKEQTKRVKLALLKYIIGLTIIIGVLAFIDKTGLLKLIILCLLIVLFNQFIGIVLYYNPHHLHPKKRRT